jgi:hypothetical protein
VKLEVGHRPTPPCILPPRCAPPAPYPPRAVSGVAQLVAPPPRPHTVFTYSPVFGPPPPYARMHRPPPCVSPVNTARRSRTKIDAARRIGRSAACGPPPVFIDSFSAPYSPLQPPPPPPCISPVNTARRNRTGIDAARHIVPPLLYSFIHSCLL